MVVEFCWLDCGPVEALALSVALADPPLPPVALLLFVLFDCAVELDAPPVAVVLWLLVVVLPLLTVWV